MPPREGVIRPVTLQELAAAQAASVLRDCAGPWETAVCAIVGYHAKKSSMQHLVDLFTVYPKPTDLANADPVRVADLLYPVLQYERKAQKIVEFSQRWCDGDFTDLRDLPGCNSIICDAVIACLKKLGSIS